MALASWTDTQVLAQLNSGAKWTNNTITYSFAQSISSMYTGDGQSGFSQVTATAQAKLALQLWDDLITNDMQQQAPGSNYLSTDIEFGMGTTNIGYAHAYFPGAGSVWFNSAYASGGNNLVSPTIGKHGFATYIHEIGHAMGLEHMGEYNGDVTSGPSCYQDSTVYSIMSYYGPSWGTGTAAGEGLVAWADWVATNGVRYSPQTPMLNDIMAIQSMYGVETTTRTGDTVYGFNSNISDGTEAVYNFTLNAHPVLCIFDSAGNDTLDLSGFSTSSVIDLAPGAFSSCDGMTSNISIAYTCSIENAVGGAGADQIGGNGLANFLTGNGGNDVLSGRDGNDRLVGGLGDDTMDGGAGNDIVVFTGTWAGITFSYSAVTSSFSFSSASDGADTVSNVEYFIDSLGVTRLASELAPVPAPLPTMSIAANAASAVEGNSGSTPYTFTIALSEASAQAQTVDWSLVLGSGAGQADAADFTGVTSGTATIAAGATAASVTINIAGDIAVESAEAFSVTIGNISTGATLGVASAAGLITNDDEGSLTLNGTSGNDVLTGGGAGDKIWGLAGNDTMQGLGSNDIMVGGAGWDAMTGGTGADYFDLDTVSQISSVTTSTVKSCDVIADFETGIDKIDLSSIDATNKISGNNAFTWIGTAAIGRQAAGELRFQQYDNAGTANDYTMIYGDTDSDAYFEFGLKLTGLINLSSSDFVL